MAKSIEYLPSTSQKSPVILIQNPYYEKKNPVRNSVNFRFLESHSVSVLKKVNFTKRCTVSIPDIFFTFSFVIVMVSSTAANHLFIASTILKYQWILAALFLIIFLMNQLLVSVFFIMRNRFHRKMEKSSYTKSSCCKVTLSTIFIIFGIDSLLIGFKLLKNALQSVDVYNPQAVQGKVPTPYYHLPNFLMSTVKIYSLFAAVIRSIPLMHAAAVLLMNKDADHLTTAQLVIITNWLVVSLAFTIALPLKRTPTIFKNSNLVPLTSLSKFMAIMSFNAANIIYFRNLVQHLKFYSFLIYLCKFGVMYGIILENSSYFWNVQTKKYFIFYGMGLALLYIIAYIHPVQTKGRLAYYFYYCFKFVSNLAVIYLSSEDYSFLMDYLVLTVVGTGFLGLKFGLSALFEA